jgi:hypothetical protein
MLRLGQVTTSVAFMGGRFQMELRELIGSHVWIKQRSSPDQVGRIASILKTVVLEDIASSVTASTFQIELRTGGVVQTTGVNILKIDHEGFLKETAHSWFRKSGMVD